MPCVEAQLNEKPDATTAPSVTLVTAMLLISVTGYAPMSGDWLPSSSVLLGSTENAKYSCEAPGANVFAVGTVKSNHTSALYMNLRVTG